MQDKYRLLRLLVQVQIWKFENLVTNESLSASSIIQTQVQSHSVKFLHLSCLVVWFPPISRPFDHIDCSQFIDKSLFLILKFHQNFSMNIEKVASRWFQIVPFSSPCWSYFGIKPDYFILYAWHLFSRLIKPIKSPFFLRQESLDTLNKSSAEWTH